MSSLEGSGVSALRPSGKSPLPVDQGGRGIGVSAHRLDGIVAALRQFCIDRQLAALRVHLKSGLFFRGAGGLPIGNQIRNVCD